MPVAVEELKQAAIINGLRSCQLFAGMNGPEMEEVARITRVKSLAKGEYLFREGEKSHGFFIVQKGALNVHRVNAAGREQVIHVFRPGESFAEATLATETGYPGDARSLQASQVLVVEKRGILDLLKRRPELALRMLGSMSMHLRVLVAQLEDLTLKDVETRLANWLVKRCPDRTGQGAVEIQLPTTKRDLALELGTVSETLSRTLAKFRARRLIAVKGRTITVLQPEPLKELLRRHLGE